MLKIGEKAIYEFSDAFGIKGGKCSEFRKKLYVTNLGNIIITSSDLSDENAERYVYSYSEYKVKLSAKLSGEEILISEKEMPFKIYSNGTEKDVFADFELSMKIDDFSYICRNQRDFIFEIDNDMSFFVIDEEKIFSGGINGDHEKFVFAGGKNRFEIYYSDIERFIVEGNMITFKGYFHIERESIVARTIQIFSNNIKNIIPYGFEDIIMSNPKIGNLPVDSTIVFGRITGSSGGYDYKSSNILFVRYNDSIIIINKKTKRTVASFEISDCRIIRNGNESIIYDGKDVFKLYINEKNRKLIGLDDIKAINDDKIGFTENGNPFFIETDNNSIVLKKDKERTIMKIENRNISDITTKDFSPFERYGYKLTRIVFGNEYIKIYIRKDTVDSLVRNIFTSSKSEEIKNADISEIYINWAKSVNDVSIYNFFSGLYKIREQGKREIESENITDETRINTINKIYDDVTSLKDDIDRVSVYMAEFTEKSISDITGTKDISSSRLSRYFEDIFYDLGYEIKDEIRDIEILVSNLSFAICTEERRRHIFRMMKENESDRLRMFTEKIISKLDHIVSKMYPYYIKNTEKRLYASFKRIEKEIISSENSDIKNIMSEKITEIYAFRQGRCMQGSDIRRKDLIENIVEEAYKSDGADSSDWFFIGGTDYEK